MNNIVLRSKGIGAIPPPPSWSDVTPPSGWSRTLPFTIEQNLREFRVKAGWDIAGAAPTGKTYYISTTGNDANDGLTPATAFRKIYTTMLKADVDRIYIETGVYGWTNGWSGGGSPTRSISFIATGGRVQITTAAEGLSWAADGAAYKATRSHVLKVADATNLDARGDFTFLTLVADAATCKATVNSWYTDATYVWVHTFDSRLPTFTVRCYFDNAGSAAQFAGNSNATCYCQDIDFEGGTTASFILGYAGRLKIGYFSNCTFKYSSGNGFQTTTGAESYHQESLSCCNGDDGFNYKSTGGYIAAAVEIDCIGRDNGLSGDIDNGSSMHDAGSIVRIMGEYMRCVGRVIHDITAGTESWNLGTIVHDSTSSVNDCNFAAGTTSDTTKMWLDCCTSSGSATDLEESTGATLLYRDLVSDGHFVGTPGTY